MNKITETQAVTTPKKGQILWLMGPTSSGKTTISKEIMSKLENTNIPFIHYDGDDIRELKGPQLTFSKDDRLSVVQGLCKLVNNSASNGINVIVSALTAGEESRKYLAEHLDNPKVIYIDCTIEECIRRDPKGLYRKAINGEIDTLIGYSEPYLRPAQLDLNVDSNQLNINQSANRIIAYCIDNNLLSH